MHTKFGAFITKCTIVINGFAMPPHYFFISVSYWDGEIDSALVYYLKQVAELCIDT